MARFLTGIFSSTPKSPPATALRVNTSLQGQPIAVIIGGQNRLAGNVIAYGNFRANPANSNSSSGKGGIGSGSSKGQAGQYTYSATFAIAICEGPIGGYQEIWMNGNPPPLPEIPEQYGGQYTQTPDAFLAAFGQALAYRGIAYTVWVNFPLGSSPQLPNFTFEIVSTNSFAIPGTPDADPSVCFSQWLTNQYWGVGFPTARLGDLSQYQAASLALGLVVSPVVPSAVSAASFLNDLLIGTNAFAKWSEGLLTVQPYYDAQITAGSIQTVTETHVVPSGTLAIQIGLPGQFVANVGVTYANGTPLVNVGVPTPLQHPGVAGNYFYYQNGIYFFALGDVGSTVLITYQYSSFYSFVPNNTSVYDFTIDDYLPNQGSIGQGLSYGVSPLIVVRKGRDQMLNNVKVEYLDRGNSYNPVDIEAKDESSIFAFKRERPSNIRQHHFFCLGSAAQLSADLQLVREQIPRTFSWTVGGHFILVLEIGFICTHTDAGQNMSLQPCRITEIQENQDGTLSCTGEEFLGTFSASPRSTQASSGTPLNYNADPGLLNTPIIFEPTDQLGGGLEIWIAISGINTALWGGAQVWVSSDGANYTMIELQLGPARMGVTTSTLPAVTASSTPPTIDTTSTLGVDLTESNGTLASGSQQDMIAGNTACYLGSGEVIAPQTASLTGTNKYNLTTINRGLYGTTIAQASGGSVFARLDSQIIKIPYTQDRIGATIYFKFPAFNIYRGGQQPLNEATPYTYTIQGTALTSPLPNVTGFTTVFQSNVTTFSWTEITDFRPVNYEIRKGASWQAGIVIGRFAHPGVVCFGDGTYWIAAHSSPIAGLDVYSPTPVSLVVVGSIIPQNVKASWDELATGAQGTMTGGLVYAAPFIQSTGALDIYQQGTVAHSNVTLTLASPGVVNWTAHGLAANQPVFFETTGALPTGLVPGTNYYVVGASITANSFQVSTSPGGGGINFTGSQSGTQVAYAGGDVFAAATVNNSLVTLTLNSPGIVNWTAHGLLQSQEVLFATTGALPTGLTPLTQYFVQPGAVDLLLHCNGPNNSTTITDTSPFVKTMTAAGNAKISTAQSLFGGSSLAFDGNVATTVSTPDAADLDPTGAFTFDFWFYPTNVGAGPANQNIFRKANVGNFPQYTINMPGSTTNLAFSASSNGTSNDIASSQLLTSSLVNNQWYHVAVTWDGSNYRGFLNGTLVFTIANSNHPYTTSPGTLYLGNASTLASPFFGYMQEIRFRNGVAQWTSSFTPPTAPYVDSAIDANFFSVASSVGGVPITFSGSQSGTTNAYAGGDILAGGPQQGGTYTIPSAHRIDVGYVAPCLVQINSAVNGVSIFNNFFAYNPLFNVQDFFGSVSTKFVSAQPQIRISQDGVTFGAWQNYVPGVYLGRKFDFQIILTTTDANTIVILTIFNFTVFVPTRVDNWALIGGTRTSLNNLALPANGPNADKSTTIVFLPDTQSTAAPFNGGVSNHNQPSLSYSILNAQPGDLMVFSSVTLAQCNVMVQNNGITVGRSVNIRPEGF